MYDNITSLVHSFIYNFNLCNIQFSNSVSITYDIVYIIQYSTYYMCRYQALLLNDNVDYNTF